MGVASAPARRVGGCVDLEQDADPTQARVPAEGQNNFNFGFVGSAAPWMNASYPSPHTQNGNVYYLNARGNWAFKGTEGIYQIKATRLHVYRTVITSPKPGASGHTYASHRCAYSTTSATSSAV